MCNRCVTDLCETSSNGFISKFGQSVLRSPRPVIQLYISTSRFNAAYSFRSCFSTVFTVGTPDGSWNMLFDWHLFLCKQLWFDFDSGAKSGRPFEPPVQPEEPELDTKHHQPHGERWKQPDRVPYVPVRLRGQFFRFSNRRFDNWKRHCHPIYRLQFSKFFICFL